MASTFKIPYLNTICPVLLFDDFIHLLIRMHHTVEALVDFNQHNLMFHTLLMHVVIKFCTYNPTSNFNIYLWNEVLQPSCKVCHNPVRL